MRRNRIANPIPHITPRGPAYAVAMRLLITAESAVSGARRDVVIDVTAQTSVAELGQCLSEALDGSAPLRDPVGASNVISLRAHGASNGASGGPPVRVFLGHRELDPTSTLEDGVVRHGQIIGIHGPSSHVEHEPEGVVEVTVASGPGAGRVHRLGIGRSLIGSAPQCAVHVPDLTAEVATLEVARDGSVTITPHESVVGEERPVPVRRDQPVEPIVLGASTMAEATGRRARRRRRKHGSTLEVGERVDPTAPTPLIHLDRRAVTSPTSWDASQVLGAGPVLLELTTPSAPDASLSPSPSRPELDYNRPPRLHPAPRPTEFALPSEPRRPDKMPIPLLMMLSPMAMSGTMYFFTRSPYSLIFMIMMPMMMLLNSSGARRTQKRRYLEQLEEYHRQHVEVEAAAVSALIGERQHRSLVAPDPAAVLLFAVGPRARLWERRRWDPDFLTLRLGTCDLPADVIVKDSSRMAHEGPLHWTTPDAPVTVDLRSSGVVGLAGTAAECRQTVSWLVAQVATMHSPADAGLWLLTVDDPHEQPRPTTGGTGPWEWAKWLPHLRSEDGRARPVRIAHDEAARSAMISELGSIVEQRTAIDKDQRANLPHVIVVLDGARELRLAPGVISLLKDGPSVNVELICLDRTVHHLPEECRSVVVHRDGRLDLSTSEQAHVDAIRPDLVDEAWLDRLARALAPIRDVSTEDLSATLPASSRLLDVLGIADLDTAELARRWTVGGTTRATIGEAPDGPFTIDVRADGPHGLIAGTTGSGKSELLQTIIAALAVGNRPDEFTFILVDYKGGAAFKDCNRLPHTVGMVTDLDGHLTARALESLGAELRYREHQLANADAKDIEDYVAAMQPGDEPMPRLLIVIDEFAALVAELPDFVSGLVDVARRGRSLGVHLILATQRPAGVVSAEIKSNTNLRIALRVTDVSDSDDVVEAPLAAHIPQGLPGRAYARRGHSSLTAFQSSRVGGRPPGTERSALEPTSFDWQRLGVRPPSEAAGDDVSVPTDLASLVAALNDVDTELGVPTPRSPWLPPLAEQLALNDLPVPEPGADPAVPPVPLGRADLPHLQRQVDETWDLARGSHLMIVGQSRSGRSTALRAIAAAIARQSSPADVHLFGVDAGNNALLPLVALPHVGAVVTRTQVDRVYRLLGHLSGELARRQQVLAEQGFADIGEQRAAVAPELRLPYLVVLLDRLEGYISAFDTIDGGVLIDRLSSLLQEGAGAGLRFVVAADRSGVHGRIAMLVEDKIMLSMNDPSDYSVIGLSARSVPAAMPPGRGFRSGERPREVQLALLDPSGVGTDQVRALQDAGRAAHERWPEIPRRLRPQRIDELPSTISAGAAAELESVSERPSFIGVGIGGDSLMWQGWDPLTDGAGFLVAGPPRSGRSTTLVGIVQRLVARRRSAVIIAPRISPLRDLADRRVTVLDGTATLEQVKAAVEALPARSRLIVVDDLEVLGMDSPITTYLAEQLAAMRDTDSALVVGCGIDEASSVYRGLVADLKRGRTGLVLAPRTSSDGEVLNARLPRSVGQAVPVGRGVLTHAGSWRWVQVPRP